MRRLVYYVATSIDGFIAADDGDASVFPTDPATLTALFAEYPETCPTHVRAALGVDAPPRHFDTVVMGRTTHQPALDAGLTSAYPHLRQFVVTHRDDLPEDPTVTAVTDPVAVVRDLKGEDGLDVPAFEADALRRIAMPSEIGMRHRSPHFAHIFSGDGYAAGYYSYLWSEVLDADAFDAFREAGDIFHPEVAARLRRFVYGAGNLRDPRAAYTGFRGRLPSIDPLLRKRGLAA